MTTTTWVFVAVFLVVLVVAVLDSGSKRHKRPSKGWRR